MVALPKRAEDEMVDSIYAAIKREDVKGSDLYLGRLGSSFIGNECNRAIWLSWRAYDTSDFDGRMLRLFETGHLQEDRIVADLKRAGYLVYDKDDEGNQFQEVDTTGHFITKLDGVIKGVPGSVNKPHILEIKTHNKNSFSGVVKHGVQKSKPLHYSQVQISMALKNINRTIYVALCKDDEQLYVERIKADPAEQSKLKAKIIRIVEATLKPAGISEDKTSFACKWCDMNEVCYGDKAPLKTCRSCKNSIPSENGTWVCGLYGFERSLQEQKEACDAYEVL